MVVSARFNCFPGCPCTLRQSYGRPWCIHTRTDPSYAAVGRDHAMGSLRASAMYSDGVRRIVAEAMS